MTITLLRQTLKLCPVSIYVIYIDVNVNVTEVIIGDDRFKEADSIFPISKDASSEFTDHQKIHGDVSAAQRRGTCLLINHDIWAKIKANFYCRI